MNSLKIADIQARNYPGGELTIERQLEDGDGYSKWIISYPSNGLKIYALLFIPASGVQPQLRSNPKSGFPLVVFNRGFVDPSEYQIDRQYTRYMEYFAKAGFAVFKSDYRGIGESEGEPSAAFTSDNATDVLNGLATLQRHPELVSGSINFDQAVIWGHSMGGQITLQCLLANKIFKAAAIWSGFMIPYADILERWQNSPLERQQNRAAELLAQFGDPQFHPETWREISPFFYLDQLPCNVQLHHGLQDAIVPPSDSEKVYDELVRVNKTGGLNLYEHGGHNLNEEDVLPEAMANTVEFFKQSLIQN